MEGSRGIVRARDDPALVPLGRLSVSALATQTNSLLRESSSHLFWKHLLSVSVCRERGRAGRRCLERGLAVTAASTGSDSGGRRRGVWAVTAEAPPRERQGAAWDSGAAGGGSPAPVTRGACRDTGRAPSGACAQGAGWPAHPSEAPNSPGAAPEGAGAPVRARDHGRLPGDGQTHPGELSAEGGVPARAARGRRVSQEGRVGDPRTPTRGMLMRGAVRRQRRSLDGVAPGAPAAGGDHLPRAPAEGSG